MNKQDNSSFITIICICQLITNKNIVSVTILLIAENQISQIINKNSRDVTNGGWILQNFLFKQIQCGSVHDHCCENNVFTLQFSWIIKAFYGTNHAG